MTKRIAYFGPAGTNTEEAALLYDREAQHLPFLSIPAVVSAVETRMADEGVVPIENSIEGSVPATLDLLIHESPLVIQRELVLPIEHHLLIKPGDDATRITVIFSHPQALGQCRRFIDRCFPKAQAVASLSTAAAVEEMMAHENAAAISTRRAAELYGARIVASGIQDQASNVTRFVVLGTMRQPRTGHDKTSLCFSVLDNKPGALYEVLGEFATRRINLAKIESRPSKESLGQYIFLVDLEGHQDDSLVVEALAALRNKVDLLKIFGSYPRWNGGA